VLDEVGLGAWAAALPDGLDARLDSRALSAGEAQLLAFARVLLSDAGLVLLDEATSRLDPATEATLAAATERALAGRTAVIVAHRRAGRTGNGGNGCCPASRRRLAWIDRPSDRKVHPTPTPTAGGIGIWIGLSAGLIAARFVPFLRDLFARLLETFENALLQVGVAFDSARLVVEELERLCDGIIRRIDPRGGPITS
jgi:hypothetical protein